MTTPLITVGIPTYNRSTYLQQAIASVQSQAYANYEILVIDNASTDDTPEVMSRLLEQDPRIRYIRNELNLGMAGNWLRITKYAAAPYLKFLMDDDLLKPGCLEAFSAAATRSPDCSLYACLADYVDEHGQRLDLKWGRYVPDGVIPSELMLRYLLRWANQIGCPTNVMFNTRSLRRHAEAIWKDTQNTWSCDYDMMIQVLTEGDFTCISEYLVSIRLHGQSETSLLKQETMQHYEWETLKRLVAILGGGEAEWALAEACAVRNAMNRGFEALYDGQVRTAARFIRRCIQSPYGRKIFVTTILQSKGRVLLPMKFLRQIFKPVFWAKRALRPIDWSDIGYRTPEMLAFWAQKLPKIQTHGGVAR